MHALKIIEKHSKSKMIKNDLQLYVKILNIEYKLLFIKINQL